MSEFIHIENVCDRASDSPRAAAVIFKKYWGRRRLAVRMLEFLLKPLAWFSQSARKPALDEVGRILVFEPGSLGDMVMLMPFLKSLRARFPEAKLSLLCRAAGKKGQRYASLAPASVKTLLLEQGLVDELIPVAIPWLHTVSSWKKYNPFSLHWPIFARQLFRLRRQPFDLAFGGGRTDIRYNLALWLTGAKRRVGFGFAGGGFLLTDVVTPDMNRPRQSDLTLQLAEHLGLQSVRDVGLLQVSPADREFACGFLRHHGVATGDFLVGVHAGSRVAARTWSDHKFREVARHLTEEYGAKVVWFADPNDSREAPEMTDLIPASLELPQFLAVLSMCRFLVCNDSGPMHMSGALGVPVVAIFGSTFPEWFCPPGDLHRAVTRRDIPCRPCGDRCIQERPFCLELIPVEQVMAEVRGVVETLQVEGRAT
jgi:ADP-heptose:LPS heptosyltransferase